MHLEEMNVPARMLAFTNASPDFAVFKNAQDKLTKASIFSRIPTTDLKFGSSGFNLNK